MEAATLPTEARATALELPDPQDCASVGWRGPDLHIVGPNRHRWIIPLEDALDSSHLLQQLVGEQPLLEAGRADRLADYAWRHRSALAGVVPVHAPVVGLACYGCGREAVGVGR